MGRPFEMVRNDFCSYSTSNQQNEQNGININQYVTGNKNNVEGPQPSVYDKIPEHSDLENEREREKELSSSKRLK